MGNQVSEPSELVDENANQSHAIDGKGFHLHILPLFVFFYVVSFFMTKFTLFNVDRPAMDNNPLYYWMGLAIVSLCICMIIFGRIMQTVSESKQMVSLVKKQLELRDLGIGSSEIYDKVKHLTSTGSLVVRGNGNSTTMRLSYNEESKCNFLVFETKAIS